MESDALESIEDVLEEIAILRGQFSALPVTLRAPPTGQSLEALRKEGATHPRNPLHFCIVEGGRSTVLSTV